MRTVLIAIVLPLGAIGCRDVGAPAAASAAVGASQVVAAQPAQTLPLDQAALLTGDGALALANLDAELDGFTAALARDPRSVAKRVAASGLHLARAGYRGGPRDLEAALALADAAVAATTPPPIEALLARADARAALHRFTDALADLDAAAARGEDGERLQAARASILAALGREDEALALRRGLAARHPSLTTLGTLGALEAQGGDAAAAEAHFLEAQARYRDISPLGLAWLYFQAGLADERAGRVQAAAERFGAARARLPAYAQATAHLAAARAASGDRDGAIALLRPLADHEDPEYAGALAALVGGAEGRALAQATAARYQALLRAHPEAYADHAARFWLAAGRALPGATRRARALAERNLALRPTRDAYALALDAAVADGATARACALAARAERLPRPGATLRLSAYRAYRACGAMARADTLLAAAAH